MYAMLLTGWIARNCPSHFYCLIRSPRACYAVACSGVGSAKFHPARLGTNPLHMLRRLHQSSFQPYASPFSNPTGLAHPARRLTLREGSPCAKAHLVRKLTLRNCSTRMSGFCHRKRECICILAGRVARILEFCLSIRHLSSGLQRPICISRHCEVAVS